MLKIIIQSQLKTVNFILSKEVVAACWYTESKQLIADSKLRFKKRNSFMHKNGIVSGNGHLKLNVIKILRWLEIVTYGYVLMGGENHSLSLDGTVMVSKNWQTIAEQVIIIFMTQQAFILTVLLAKTTLKYSFRGL